MHVCNMILITFKSFEIRSSFLVHHYILIGYGSGSYIKVIVSKKIRNPYSRSVKFQLALTQVL